MLPLFYLTRTLMYGNVFCFPKNYVNKGKFEGSCKEFKVQNFSSQY